MSSVNFSERVLISFIWDNGKNFTVELNTVQREDILKLRGISQQKPVINQWCSFQIILPEGKEIALTYLKGTYFLQGTDVISLQQNASSNQVNECLDLDFNRNGIQPSTLYSIVT